MFHVDLAPLGGILDPLKSDLGVFWAKIPLSSDWFYNVKTQKTLFLQNSQSEMAKIENIHCTICTQPISSSWQNALPPAFAPLEQRGVGGRRCAISLDLQKIKWYVGLSDGKDVSLSLSFLQLDAYAVLFKICILFHLWENVPQLPACTAATKAIMLVLVLAADFFLLFLLYS